jgi:DNA helicase II / ATP-dependent DNA helicase PcrA
LQNPLSGDSATGARPRVQSALLHGLTAEQAHAVTYGSGPLLIIAGPGAGKTRTLIHRIAWLLMSGLARPWEILAVTFSVRATGELRLRLTDLLGEQVAAAVTAATFHSVCARMLREDAALFGRTADYTIYDQADMRHVIEWLLSDSQRGAIQAGLDAYGQPASTEVAAEISLAKDRLLSPLVYERSARHPAAPLIAEVWRQAEEELRRSNAFSFDDLLVGAVQLLAEHPHRLAYYRERWKWVVVDEFQDTNEAQGVLVTLLAGADGNVCAVADDDQLIYSWRGAEPRNVLEFGKRFPGLGRVVLARNFRSRSEILNAAVACVSQNERRTAKALIAVRGDGGRVHVRAFQSEYHEAHWIARTIGQALAAGIAPAEILVLARASYATEAVQTALAQAGIPHRVLGSLELYERSEVRDALAYLTLLVNPADAQAFRRAVQAPRRGVGTATITKLVALARERHHGDLIVASAQGADVEAVRRQSTRDRLAAFGDAMKRVRGHLCPGRSVGHVVVSTMMIEGGLVADHQHRRDHASTASQRRDAERVLEDLRSLCRAAQNYESQHPDHATLTGFLEMAAGLHAQEVKPGQEDRRITVSTVHRAKGTEAALVIVAGCEERLFPTWRALQAADNEQLSEERRVFYVACTRAKDGLFLTYAHQRGGRPTAGPSQFLYEAGLIRRTSMAA